MHIDYHSAFSCIFCSRRHTPGRSSSCCASPFPFPRAHDFFVGFCIYDHRQVIKDFLRDNENHPCQALIDYVVGNSGFIFTNADLSSVRDVVVGNKVPAPARVGAIAPVDVWVEPGPTGCDPGQTSWFQALNIPTKVCGCL